MVVLWWYVVTSSREFPYLTNLVYRWCARLQGNGRSRQLALTIPRASVQEAKRHPASKVELVDTSFSQGQELVY